MRRFNQGGVVLIAAVLAAVTARPYGGAWNDGSRLATVESLVDRHTFAIDDSIYLNPSAAARPPYDPAKPLVARYGTLDKLLIDGRWYSDKSPVPAVLMAGPYQVWRWAGGPSAADRPDLFALGLTWLFAGLPYVLAVWAVGRITRSVDVPPPWDLVLTAGFALTGLALPYAEQVNNHILLLAVAAGVCEVAVRPGPWSTGRAAWLGMLAGFGYTIDLGAGPPLALAAAGLLVWQVRPPGRWRIWIAFAVAAVPFALANHVITYAIAGTIGPPNANPAYLDWPGSPFTGPNMTGRWHHASAAKAGLYALDLLYGKKGFLFHSPPMLLAVAGLPLLNWRRVRERPALVAMCAWAVATWLLYAATSRNLAGECLSIRWFVPLSAAGYLVLAVLIREVPAARTDLVVLLAGSLVIAVEGTIRGPWYGRILSTYWPVVGITLAAWGVVWARRFVRWLARRRSVRSDVTTGTGSPGPSRAATTG
jgi:hypothetical protein